MAVLNQMMWISTRVSTMYQARTWLSRSFSSVSSNPLHVCVVGSGPAGFYTAEKMLKAHQEAEVDIIDRLPTPFGLVRYGVAPDHPETKNVMNQFSRVMQHERCSFYGNITLGSSISLPELRELYHIVILAYGAESDRALGIPGEDLKGIHSAREIVWWYNGHPDCDDLNPDVENTDTVVILGHGNVALDVARILLKPPRELLSTDISLNALAALEQSAVRKVYVVGRRGPLQAAFTTKELREALAITNLYVRVRDVDLHKSPEDEEELKNNRMKNNIYDLLKGAAHKSKFSYPSPRGRELHFAFHRRPVSFIESETDKGHVAGVRVEKTVVKDDGHGNKVAEGTGMFDELECGMVIKSIGYRSVPVDGLPFDDQEGIVPNVKGRVLTDASAEETSLEKGLYVSGWLKRGPTGIIATTLYCAEETVASITEDIREGKLEETLSSPKPGKEGLLQLLEDKDVKVIPYKGWQQIDQMEKNLGPLRHKDRVNLTSWDHLLKFGTMNMNQ